MLKEKPLVENPYSSLRRTIAIVLYVLFMTWIIYSHSKPINTEPANTKKTISAFP